MQWGVCGGPDMAAVAAKAGYDYVETTVAGLLKPREDEAAFQEALAGFRAVGLPCPAVNCFIPGDLSITGPEVDMQALTDYVTITCQRARAAGLEIIVFGSGGARRIPEDFDRAAAGEQLIAFGKMVGPIASEAGITIAVEPLNVTECNVLVAVGESADYVHQVDHPAVRLLVDGYHWAKDADSAEDIVESGPLLVHTHVATKANRLAPGAEPDDDLAGFFTSLRQSGYDSRCSVEGRIPEPEAELPPALALMKSLWG